MKKEQKQVATLFFHSALFAGKNIISLKRLRKNDLLISLLRY